MNFGQLHYILLQHVLPSIHVFVGILNCDNFYLSLKVINGGLEVFDAHTSNLVNHQNNVEIMNLFEGTGSNSLLLELFYLQ
jgi:hypothetical protein